MPSTSGSRRWLGYALVTTLTWGLWGAFSDLPAKHGFPETLTYVVWSATMLLPAGFVLRREGWKVPFDPCSIALGLVIGLSGAGGVIMLFPTLSIGPSYLIFPIISLAPAITIAFSGAFLRERTERTGVLGIALALISLPLINDWKFGAANVHLGLWFVLSLAITVLWGLQNFFIKIAHSTMDTGAIFFYMTLGGLLLDPVAVALTQWNVPINLGPDGPLLSAAVQLLNAVGSLTIVYALREGKAIVVSPLTNAASPLITALIAMAIAGEVPPLLKLAGIGLAVIASALLALQTEEPHP